METYCILSAVFIVLYILIQNLINEFMAFRQQNLNEILNQQHKYYRF